MKKIHALRVALKKLIPLHWPKIVHAKETITKLGKNMWLENSRPHQQKCTTRIRQVGEESSICIPDGLFIFFSLLFLFIMNRGWVN